MPYFPQGAPEMGYLRHLILLYGRDISIWNAERIRPYLAYMNEDGKPLDWFFDSLLFVPMTAASGRSFGSDVNLGTTMCGEGDFYPIPVPNPATRKDYDDLLDVYFGDGGYLDAMNAGVESLKCELPAPAHKHNAVLMTPYPGIMQPMWGRLPGSDKCLNFSTVKQGITPATMDRLAATNWFADECVARWDDARWPNVSFLGFYWPFETVYHGWEVDDHLLLKEHHKHLKQLGKVMTWIPFSSTYNTHLLDNYQDYYFDLAFQQPNHMFYVNTPGIEGPAAVAKARNAGFEMEYYLEWGEPFAVLDERQKRFRDYLNGGAKFGFMKEAACAWYHGRNGIAQMWDHEDPVERAYYHDIYRFVKGTYEIKED
ncbi:MAG TPA: DUF4855 domain-containing protein [Armatimonadota bacterium]|jgi:hypothetical protein